MLISKPTLGASDGARSIWNDEHSITCTRSSDGGGRSRIGTPILPPIATSRPACRKTWAIRAVVVDFPFVPVIATKGAAGARAARSRAKSSMSPTITRPAAFAHSTVQCGLGSVSGTPGARTKSWNFDQSAAARSTGAKPAAAAFARAASLSSQPATSAPPATSARNVERPEPPSPNRATRLPADVATGVMSPQLQSGEADHRQHESDDPEPHDDLRLGPAELLEMMMNRRHAEDPPARQLERGHLHHDGKRLHDEKSADDRQHDLVLDGDRRSAQQASEGEGTGVAHENLRRRRIEPEKPHPRADHRAAYDHEVAGVGNVIEQEVSGVEHVAGEIRDQPQRRRRYHDRHDRESVETVRQVHRVAEGDDDERAEQQKPPTEIADVAVEEGHRQRSRSWVAGFRQRETRDQRDQELSRQSRAAGEAEMGLLRHLEIVIIKSDHREAGGDEQYDPDVGTQQIRPKQRRGEQSEQDHQPPHRRRTFLGQHVGRRSVEADRLALALFEAQRRDDRGAEEEDEEQSGRRRAECAERQIAEKIEDPEYVREVGQPGQHLGFL